uniref:Uncharacterized protein n=1 Tax=Arundo donax TaxID=35708 RepID=A0A0A8ZSG5_ARUDO
MKLAPGGLVGALKKSRATLGRGVFGSQQ